MPKGLGLVVGFWYCWFFLFVTVLTSAWIAHFRLVCFDSFFSSWNTAFGSCSSLSLIHPPHCNLDFKGSVELRIQEDLRGSKAPSRSLLHCPGPGDVQVRLFHVLCSGTAQDQHLGKPSSFLDTQDGFFHCTRAGADGEFELQFTCSP